MFLFSTASNIRAVHITLGFSCNSFVSWSDLLCHRLWSYDPTAV